VAANDNLRDRSSRFPFPYSNTGLGLGKILLLLGAVAFFLAMQTWDRGHFQHKQSIKVEKSGTKK
jgi:hypothetical protein